MNKLNGPNRILAGPGTGKTTFLISKTSQLFDFLSDNHQGVIISTFTRKATDELISRLYKSLSVEQINKINFIIGTIHSICFELLSRYSEKDYGDFEILAEESQIHFIHSKLANLGFSNDRIKKNGWQLAEELATVYNKITDHQIEFSTLDYKNDIELEEACHTYDTYKKLLNRNRLFDFATIQSTLLAELNSSPIFLNKIQKDFNYFLVDEFQDVNNLQNEIFITLSGPSFNLTIVGDDDQSIYAFRGSSVDHIRNFNVELENKGLNVVNNILNVNYRSTSDIVEFTNSILDNVKYPRIEKDIKAFRKGINHPVVINEFSNEVDESQFIIQTINELKNRNIISSYDQIAILFRSLKGHAKSVINALSASNIPYVLTGAGNFFDSIVGQEFLAILEYYLAKDIEKTQIFYDQLAIIDINYNTDLTTVYSNLDFINNLERIFENKNYKSCIDLCYDIFIGTNFLSRYNIEGPNLGKLTDIVLKFDDYSDRFDPWGLFSYLTYLKKNQEVDYEQSENNNAVNIMTIHQSKGLEFPVVFMPSQMERNKRTNINDRLNKLINASNQNYDEDHRVFYVGCTRAEDLLIISGSKTLNHTKKTYELNSIIKQAAKNINHKLDLDYDLLKSQNFRNTNTKRKKSIKLSYNKVNLYNFCPRAYQYSNVWNLQTVRIGGLEFGRNIHKIIEIIIREILSGCNLRSIDMDTLVENNWKNANFKNDDQNEKFKTAAKTQLNQLLVNCKDYLRLDNIFSVEDEFNISIGETLITGRFDAVFKNNDGFTIIDFKTGDARDYSSQLSFYKLCFKQKYNENQSIKLAVYFLKEGRLEFIKENNEEDEIDKIRTVANAISNNEFYPKPGKNCKDCSFNNICEYAL